MTLKIRALMLLVCGLAMSNCNTVGNSSSSTQDLNGGVDPVFQFRGDDAQRVIGLLKEVRIANDAKIEISQSHSVCSTAVINPISGLAHICTFWPLEVDAEPFKISGDDAVWFREMLENNGFAPYTGPHESSIRTEAIFCVANLDMSDANCKISRNTAGEAS